MPPASLRHRHRSDRRHVGSVRDMAQSVESGGQGPRLSKQASAMTDHVGPLVKTFIFEPIECFDARRGYKRCKLPGVGCHFFGRPGAQSDLWRDRSDNLVARFSSQGYRFSFAVTHASGVPLVDDQIDGLEDHLIALLKLWLVEGIDDWPSTEIG